MKTKFYANSEQCFELNMDSGSVYYLLELDSIVIEVLQCVDAGQKRYVAAKFSIYHSVYPVKMVTQVSTLCTNGVTCLFLSEVKFAFFFGYECFLLLPK